MTLPLRFLQSLQKRGDVVRLGRAYYVGGAEALRELLVERHADYDKGVQFDRAKIVIGNSLPCSAGSFHRNQRKAILPAFAQARLREYFDIMLACADRDVSSWTARTDTYTEVRKTVALIACRTLFDTSESAAIELVEMVEALDNGVVLRILDPTGLLGKLPLRANRAFDHAVARTHELVSGFIEQYQQSPPARADLLSTLLSATDMPAAQLRDEAVAMAQAGIETTAQALRWVFLLLAEHPSVQRRVQREIDGVLGDRELTFDDLPRLDLLSRVIRETLRLYPPLYVVTRRALVDTSIAGHRIPAGRTVIFSPYAAQRDPARYPEPGRFDPDRAFDPVPVEFFPFGAGIRSCAGERFAQIEMLTVMVAVLRKWTLVREPGVVVKPKLSFVLKPNAGGTRLVVREWARSAPAN
ncbi:cytochrome P450 [Lentzea sp. NPDC005914]|uniref:cytochrome P450 n=1 Tax=Lentzea sp. NPDC005914 TaxID=3154572 RepID=UPI0033F8D792